MSAERAFLIVLVVLIGVSSSIPGIGYALGLLMIDGRPIPADPSKYASVDLVAAWRNCGEVKPLLVAPLNPWSYAAKFIVGSSNFEGDGRLAAWQIARKHNRDRLPGGMFWWHLSGASLTVWITRHWTGDQIAATLIRDGLCSDALRYSRAPRLK